MKEINIDEYVKIKEKTKTLVNFSVNLIYDMKVNMININGFVITPYMRTNTILRPITAGYIFCRSTHKQKILEHECNLNESFDTKSPKKNQIHTRFDFRRPNI